MCYSGAFRLLRYSDHSGAISSLSHWTHFVPKLERRLGCCRHRNPNVIVQFVERTDRGSGFMAIDYAGIKSS